MGTLKSWPARPNSSSVLTRSGPPVVLNSCPTSLHRHADGPKRPGMENDPGKSPQVQLEVKTCVSRHSCCAQGAARTFQPLWSRLRKVTKARWRMKPLGPRTDPEPRQRMEPLPGPGLQSSGTVSCSFGSSLSLDPIPSETPGTVPALPRGVSAGRALLPPVPLLQSSPRLVHRTAATPLQ